MLFQEIVARNKTIQRRNESFLSCMSFDYIINCTVSTNDMFNELLQSISDHR